MSPFYCYVFLSSNSKFCFHVQLERCSIFSDVISGKGQIVLKTCVDLLGWAFLHFLLWYNYTRQKPALLLLDFLSFSAAAVVVELIIPAAIYVVAWRQKCGYFSRLFPRAYNNQFFVAWIFIDEFFNSLLFTLMLLLCHWRLRRTWPVLTSMRATCYNSPFLVNFKKVQ